MAFEDQVSVIAKRLPAVRESLLTEEATKTALVMPFLQAMGYDVFDPSEVVPEFTADVGIKKGEKVDYAVMDGSDAIILFECKPCGAKLNRYSSQLYRYFSVTSARVAVLTDGVVYRFYSDLGSPNRLDERPFMVLDLDDPDDRVIGHAGHLCKGCFDLEKVLATATAMKDLGEVRTALEAQLEAPTDAFVRLLIDPIHEGRMTQGVLDRFRPLVKTALTECIARRVDERLQSALRQNREESEEATAGEEMPAPGESDVETTMEELEGFYAIKAILHGSVEPTRVTGRDVQSYFGVLLDNNNRKPICRLWFNRRQKYLGVFDSSKNEKRIPIQSVHDLFAHGDEIIESLRHVL